MGDTPGRERPQRSGCWVTKRTREGGRSRPGTTRGATVHCRTGGTARRPMRNHRFRTTSARPRSCRRDHSADRFAQLGAILEL
jgi:hypothetical protein